MSKRAVSEEEKKLKELLAIVVNSSRPSVRFSVKHLYRTIDKLGGIHPGAAGVVSKYLLQVKKLDEVLCRLEIAIKQKITKIRSQV